jgi:hypothetical protein
MELKSLATLVVLASAFVACGGEEPPPPQPPPPPPVAPPPPPATAEAPPAPPPKPTLADLVPVTLKNITDAFNAHDAQKFAANYTADAVVTDYGAPAEAHGRDDIAKSTQTLFDLSSDVKGAAAHVWSKGNVVVVDWVTAGTATGDFMGAKPTKKPFGNHRLIVAQANDDGVMTGSHGYSDFAGVMAQIRGAKDAPAVPAVPATTEMHSAKNSLDEDKLVDWFKADNDAFNKGDPKAMSALFAPDGDVTFQFMGGKVLKVGPELDKFHADLFKAIPNAQFSIVNAWGIDGFVIAERTISGKQKGRLGPLPASNKDVTLHVADVLLPSADGKISHAWAFGNLAEAAPPPAAKPAAAPKAAAAAPAGSAVPKPAPKM